MADFKHSSQADIVAIKAVTDVIPNAGVMTSIAQASDITTILASWTALPKQAGVCQTFTKAVTSAANAGAVTVATVTTQPVIIESIVLHSDGVTTADLTSAAITGGAAGVISFLSATDAAVANINAQDEQVWWQGSVYFPTAATIVITLAGTGATAVDLNVVIKYRATVNGGYLA